MFSPLWREISQTKPTKGRKRPRGVDVTVPLSTCPFPGHSPVEPN